MKNTIKIFLRDMKKMLTSPFALVILGGLIILPSLYAWLNIQASWNPYDRTDHIKIAVSNNDEGATFYDLDVNVGDDVEKELKANDKIDWVFLSEKEVRDAVNNGEYYAGVIIPEDFSEDFLSITTDKITKPSIEYIINDKLNAIAPKITDAGVTTLHSEINEKFTETISKQLLLITKKIDKALKDTNAVDNAIAFLERTSNDLDDLVLVLNSAIDLGKPISESVDLLNDSTTHLQSALKSTTESIDEGQKALKETENLSQTAINAVSAQFDSIKNEIKHIQSSINNLVKDIESSKEVALSDLQFISSKLSSAKTQLNEISKEIKNFNDKLPVRLPALDKVCQDINSTANILNDAKNKIDNLKEDISSTELERILNQINKDINKQFDIIDGIKSTYTTAILPLIDNMKSNINSSFDNIKTSLITANSGIDLIKSTMSSTDSIINASTNTLKSVKKLVLNSKEDIDENIKIIKSTVNQSEIQVLIDTITENPTLASDFFADPVKIKEVKLYEIANYGSAMSPFYLVLCLWVGGMFLMSVLKTSVKEDKHITNIKRREAYFGRGLTYTFIAIIQGIVASVGGLLILNITVASPVEFVLMCVYTSVVFSIIIYGLVAGLGNIGKAITIVLLVLQVAGAGGTFPVELTPDFFGKLNPFFPFTYAINAVRETVGGINPDSFTHDILMFSIFIPIGLLIGLLLNKRFKKINEYVERKMEETDVMI